MALLQNNRTRAGENSELVSTGLGLRTEVRRLWGPSNLRIHFYFQLLPQHKKNSTLKTWIHIQRTLEQHRGEGRPHRKRSKCD